jgi:hypothetical protein
VPSIGGQLVTLIKMVRSLNKKSSALAFSFIAMLVLTPIVVFAPQSSIRDDNDALMVIVNLERIRAQLSLTEQNLDAGAIDMAFAHAFIIHYYISISQEPDRAD